MLAVYRFCFGSRMSEVQILSPRPFLNNSRPFAEPRESRRASFSPGQTHSWDHGRDHSGRRCLAVCRRWSSAPVTASKNAVSWSPAFSHVAS